MSDPPTWWLTGLPGAGKTTLAQALAKAVRQQGHAACVVDGDELRAGLCGDLGFDENSRAENVRRAAEIAKLLNANGICAIVALVSPAANARTAAYASIGPQHCIEIHVNTPLAVCEARDPKGLYARARAGEQKQMTGIQASYDSPLTPALRIDTSQTSLESAVAQILHCSIGLFPHNV